MMEAMSFPVKMALRKESIAGCFFSLVLFFCIEPSVWARCKFFRGRFALRYAQFTLLASGPSNGTATHASHLFRAS